MLKDVVKNDSNFAAYNTASSMIFHGRYLFVKIGFKALVSVRLIANKDMLQKHAFLLQDDLLVSKFVSRGR